MVAGCGGGAAAGAGGGASETDSLTLTGPVKADSSGAKGSGGCQWTPAVFELKFTSAQMQNGAQVKFDVTLGIGGLGDPDAATPVAADGSTPVELVAAGKTIHAASGTVHVSQADLSARTWKGTLDATFVDGTHATGSWSCQAS